MQGTQILTSSDDLSAPVLICTLFAVQNLVLNSPFFFFKLLYLVLQITQARRKNSLSTCSDTLHYEKSTHFLIYENTSLIAQ